MDIATALQHLRQSHELSILKISQSALSPTDDTGKRTSNASTDDSAQISQTPTALATDLAHYQELFSKLRFSYVEQVTKERFLQSIVADPPDFVDAAENTQLEGKLTEDKARLQAMKEEMRGMVGEIEEQGRSLAQRYQNAQLETAQLESLPNEITHLQETISALQSQQGPKSNNPDFSMPLQPTLELLSEHEAQLAYLDTQIAALHQCLPNKRERTTQLETELHPLKLRKMRAIEDAKEARRRRENGGLGDEIEERGRWLQGVDAALWSMLEVQ